MAQKFDFMCKNVFDSERNGGIGCNIGFAHAHWGEYELRIWDLVGGYVIASGHNM